MKIESKIIVIVMCLVARGYSEKIQCYECDDCNGIGQLVSCPVNAVITQQNTILVTSPKADVTIETDLSTLAAESTTELKSIPTESTESPTTPAQPPPESPSVPAADGIVSAQNQPFGERRISRRSIQDSSNFFCYQIEITDGDRNKTQKGCVEVPKNVTGCSVLEAQYAVKDGSCSVCLTHKCNSGATLKYSFATFFIVSVMSLYF